MKIQNPTPNTPDPTTRREILGKLEPKVREQQRGMISAEDQERIEFLRRLNNAVSVEVTDWETGFIDSFLGNARPMTAAQRGAVDDMRERYEGLI